MGTKARTGAVTFTMDREQIRENSDGSITVPGRLTKTGIFEYRRGDTTVRELRSDAEVFAEDALETLRGAPVTVDHPPDFLKLDNLDAYQVGSVSFVAPNPPYVDGKLRIWKEDAIHRIKGGFIKEISCGYACVPQELETADADVEQTRLDYNHVAIGPEQWGRLGSDVSLRLDSNGEEIVTPFEATNKEPTMDEIKEALAPVLDAIQGLTERIDKVEAQPEPEKKADSPIHKEDPLPDSEHVAKLVSEQAHAMLALELKARDASEEIFSWQWDERRQDYKRNPTYHVDPVLCARRLVEDVLHTVDSSVQIKDSDDLAPFVREAELLAKRARQERLARLDTRDSLSKQLTGVRAHMLDTNTKNSRFPASNKGN